MKLVFTFMAILFSLQAGYAQFDVGIPLPNTIWKWGQLKPSELIGINRIEVKFFARDKKRVVQDGSLELQFDSLGRVIKSIADHCLYQKSKRTIFWGYLPEGCPSLASDSTAYLWGTRENLGVTWSCNGDRIDTIFGINDGFIIVNWKNENDISDLEFWQPNSETGKYDTLGKRKYHYDDQGKIDSIIGPKIKAAFKNFEQKSLIFYTIEGDDSEYKVEIEYNSEMLPSTISNFERFRKNKWQLVEKLELTFYKLNQN